MHEGYEYCSYMYFIPKWNCLHDQIPSRRDMSTSRISINLIVPVITHTETIRYGYMLSKSSTPTFAFFSLILLIVTCELSHWHLINLEPTSQQEGQQVCGAHVLRLRPPFNDLSAYHDRLHLQLMLSLSDQNTQSCLSLMQINS